MKQHLAQRSCHSFWPGSQSQESLVACDAGTAARFSSITRGSSLASQEAAPPPLRPQQPVPRRGRRVAVHRGGLAAAAGAGPASPRQAGVPHRGTGITRAAGKCTSTSEARRCLAR